MNDPFLMWLDVKTFELHIREIFCWTMGITFSRFVKAFFPSLAGNFITQCSREIQILFSGTLMFTIKHASICKWLIMALPLSWTVSDSIKLEITEFLFSDGAKSSNRHVQFRGIMRWREASWRCLQLFLWFATGAQGEETKCSKIIRRPQRNGFLCDHKILGYLMAVENRKANAAAFLFSTSLIASFPANARDSSKAIKRWYKVCDNRGSGHVMKIS